MGKFFINLVSDGLLTEWANILDWLFDDTRFSKKKGWDRNRVDSFTKRLKKRLCFKKTQFTYESSKKLVFPNTNQDGYPTEVCVIMSKGESQGRDIIRHIRNGIAHGRTYMTKIDGNTWIEIIDCKHCKGQDEVQEGKAKYEQTAYMFFPIEYIPQLYRIYMEVEQGISKGKNGTSKKETVHRAVAV